MNKSFSIIFLILFLTYCTQQNQTISNVERSQIKGKILESFQSLAVANDEQNWDVYFSHFDLGNFSGINADGTAWESFQDFEASLMPSFSMIESSDSLYFPIIKITVLDKNTAILVNEYEQKITLISGQEFWARGAGTQIWSKKNGEWKLVSVSASSK